MNVTKASAHTPGPWSVAGEQTGNDGWNDARHIFARADRDAGGTGCIALVRTSSANARLIAAAPELFAALQLYFAADPRFHKAASDALAKAGGQ